MIKLYGSIPEDTTIWRYMDFAKFVDILVDEGLYFCRPDKLGDNFETAYSKNDEKILRNSIDSELGIPIEDSIKRYVTILRNSCLVNCWHISDYESAAMWKIYLGGSVGVAIKSKVSNLKKCFEPLKEEFYIGPIDYNKHSSGHVLFSEEGLLTTTNLVFCKRKIFDYEKELRIVLLDEENNKKAMLDVYGNPFDDDRDNFAKGLINKNTMKELERLASVYGFDGGKELKEGAVVKVNLKDLVDEVYIYSKSDDLFIKRVESILEKYQLDKEVKISDMDTKPNM